jgi:hypothetical protein
MYRSFRSLLPVLTVLYVGVALMAIPFLTEYHPRYSGLLHDSGMLLSIGALVWLFSRRIEGQLEMLLHARSQQEKYAVDDVGVTSRFDVVELVKNIPLREPRMVVVNREDVPMLFEILRYALKSSDSECRILICNWDTDKEAVSRSEQAHLASWVHDFTRHLGRGAELRVNKDRTSKVIVQTAEKLLLLVPITAEASLYTFTVLARWGSLAEALRLEADVLWSTAARYEDIS